jgi:FkbM family methyltransferase
MNDLETEILISELSRFWISAEVSVVQAGAHLGEEAADYKAAGWSNVIWIEANPDLIPKLVEATSIYPKSKVVHAAIWSTSKFPITLNIATNSYSSSVLNFGSHKRTYPDITFNGRVELPSTSLDDILTSHPIRPPGFIDP